MTRTFALCLVLAVLATPSFVHAQAAKIPAVESDPLPPGAERRLGTNRLRLPNRVAYFMFSPDDSTLMVGSGGGVHFWDTKTWRETWKLDSTAFTCSPDGKHVAKKVDDFTIEIWDVQKKALVHTRNLIRETRNSRIFDIEFNPKGNLLWVGVSRQGVWLYDWDANKVEQRIDMPDVQEASLTHSRDRKAFVLHRQSGQFVVFDGVTGKKIRQVNNNRPTEWHFLSHDGKILAAGDSRPTYQFWDVATGNPVALLPDDIKQNPAPKIDDDNNGPPPIVEDAPFDRSRFGNRPVFDSKGEFVLLGGAKLQTIDVKKKAVVATATLQGLFPMAFAVSNDNKTLAIGYEDGSVELRDPATLASLIDDPHPRGPVLGLSFTRDGQTLAAFNGNKTAVRLWNPRDGKLIRSFEIDVAKLRSVPPLAFAENDRRIALGADYSWKVGSGEPVAAAARKDRAVSASGDGGRWLFSKENDLGEVSELTVEDLVAGRLVAKLPIDTSADTTLMSYHLRSSLSDNGAFAALHKRLVNRRDPNTGDQRVLEDALVVWNLQGAKPLQVFSTLCRRVPKAVELSPAGHYLAAQGEPSAELPHQLWHLPTGFTLWKVASGPAPKLPSNRSPYYPGDDMLLADDYIDFGFGVDSVGDNLAFSPDAQFLAASGSGSLVIREALSGATLMTLSGQAGRIGALAFSPDGRTLATGSSDSTVVFWKVPPFAGAGPGLWNRANFEKLWGDLKGNGSAAYQAMANLHAGGDEAVALLKDKVLPETDTERRQIVQTLAELASPKFATREKASARLEKWDFRLKPYLAAAVAQSNDLEQRRRLMTIVERRKGAGIDAEELRLARSAYLLERIGTQGARVILENLARGHANDLTSQTARGALTRLAKNGS